ncbi:MAG TPA: phosphatidylserine/phosphatidylglycerophosphate/cardiolipin synthase family protein [Luteolibacter sp.]|nr:phosphatidylserine/phosphatidylglycerophosphate/cardiolipin synthase family protein [Luteolibacter sp.]
MNPVLSILPLIAVLASCAQPALNARRSLERIPQANPALESGIGLTGTVVRSTALAAVRQPFTTTRLGIAMMWHRPREFVSANIPLDLNTGPLPDAIPGSLEFEKWLDEKTQTVSEGGRLAFLLDGPTFFGELDTRIAAALRSIDCQVFIFDNDDIGVRYADQLRQRAETIPVRVLFDDLGTTFAHSTPPETPGPPGFVPPVDMEVYLKSDSPLRVRRTLNPWLICDHTKLLVFDRETALLGGMNIGREYFSEWRDLMVRVDGPVVGRLGREFEDNWRKNGPVGDFSALWPAPARYRPAASGNDIPIRVLRTHAAGGEQQILDAILLAIRAARTRIWIETPYFSHDDIALAAASAANRGVDVRVIVPSRGDSTIMDIGNLATARALIRAGARIYQYPRMTHLKAIVCDDWACVGSANLDTLSMRLNRELNIAFADAATIREFENIVFRPAFRDSRQMDLKATESLLAPFAEALADQL